MKKKLFLKILAIVVLLLVHGVVIYFVNRDKPVFPITESSGTEYENARVLSILSDNTIIDETTENVKKGSMDLKVELLTGRYKGQICFIKNYFSALYNVDVKAGDTLCVRIDTTGAGEYSVSVYNYNRVPVTVLIIGLFLALLAFIGGWKGVKAFLSLAYTFVCIVYIVLPLSLKGANTVAVSALVIFVTTTVSFVLISGLTKKTLSAELGCMCGVLVAALLGAIFSRLAGVSTFQTDEAEALLLVKSTFDLKMRGLFTAGILISSMGAVMDVAMSVASSLYEIARLNGKMPAKELFKSGMNVGRDAMGTMANTLVLAFAGSSLNMMVLIYSYGVSFRQLLNTDFVATELIRAVSGSIGIICTVPCVAIISALMFSRKSK